MEQGFRDRASRVEKLLSDPGTAFVLVASPRRDAVAEAVYFADRLAASGGQVGALVANRMFPLFGPVPAPLAEASGDAGAAPVLAELAANVADFDRVASREDGYINELASRLPGACIVRVPFLESDVHDIAGLDEIDTWLFGENLTNQHEM